MTQPTVIDVTTATFQRDVVELSREIPVLIDFWAAWCGPCKTLGPLLEKLAAEHAGRFVLAKVDIDRNPELAEVFRIQSIPSVILVKAGRPVDGFLGLLPEAQLRAFLEPHLPPAAASPRDRALTLEAEGQLEQAIALLREHLRGGAADPEARTTLARLLLAVGRAGEARKVFEKLAAGERETDEARAVEAQLAMLEFAGDLEQLSREAEAAPRDPAARIAFGKALLAVGRHEEGLEELISAATLELEQSDVAGEGAGAVELGGEGERGGERGGESAGESAGAARQALVDAFQMLGPTHPSTLEYQQRLSVLLCS